MTLRLARCYNRPGPEDVPFRLHGSTSVESSTRHGRPLFPALCSKAAIPLSARSCHSAARLVLAVRAGRCRTRRRSRRLFHGDDFRRGRHAMGISRSGTRGSEPCLPAPSRPRRAGSRLSRRSRGGGCRRAAAAARYRSQVARSQVSRLCIRTPPLVHARFWFRNAATIASSRSGNRRRRSRCLRAGAEARAGQRA